MKTLLSLCLGLNLIVSAYAQVTINPTSRSFAKEGGGGSILTSGSGTWTASTTANWITVTPRTSGTAGDSCIYVVNSNFSADSRQAVINVSTHKHTVNQTGYTASLNPTSASFDYTGGNGQISIATEAGVSWTAVANTNWVTVTPSSGISVGTVSYTVAPYGGVTTRTTSLTIAGKTFSISQTGLDVNIAPYSKEMDYQANIVQVQVTALWDTSWSVAPQSSWISVIDGGSGAGDSTITLAVGTNPSYQTRTGIVSIGSATFNLTQRGTSQPILDITPPTTTADAVGAYGNVAVLATPDAPWTAKSLDPWIVISDGTAGAGNGNIQYVVSSNPDLVERTGRIQISPPIYQAPSDLSWMLFSHVYNTSSDVSGWGRSLSSSLPYNFGGTSSLKLTGQSFDRSDNAFSIAFWFNIGNSDTINRLMQVQRANGSHTVIYVDAMNRLTVHCGTETLVTSLQVQTGVQYQLVITADAAQNTTIYAGKRGESIGEVGSKTFAVHPFPTPYVSPSMITLGYSVLPNSGFLANATINDFRVYGRSLSAYEAFELHRVAGTATPYGAFSYTGDAPNVEVEYNLQGQGLAVGGKHNQYSDFKFSLSSWMPEPDRFGLSGKAIKNTVNSTLILKDSKNTMFRSSGATYNFWMRFDEMPSSGQKVQVFVRKWSNNYVSSFYCSLLHSGRLEFGVGASPIQDYPANLEIGKWHMITIAGEMYLTTRFYVDGVEIGNTPVNYYFGRSNTSPDSSSLEFGRWAGAIDYVGFYSGALSTPQIKAVYDAQKPRDLYHVVTQEIITPAITPEAVTVSVAGGTISSALTLAHNVNWTASTASTWLQITSADSGAGSTTVDVLASANPTVYERQGTVTIAGKTFTITQAGLGSSVSSDETVFGTDGGSSWVDISTEGNAQWQAVSQVSWLTVAIGTSGTGAGSVFIVADPYTQTSSSRIGGVLIGGHMVYFTQRGFDLSVVPQVARIGSNADAGEFGVVAPIGSIWEAITTHPWITINGGTSGQGNGTLRYSVAANTTGETRTGKVIVSGREYTITQLASLLVTTYTDGGGTISGSGSYQTLANATLTATPAAGYVFSHWTGDAVGSANPLALSIDSSKTVKGHFVETSLADTIALNSRERLGLYTTDQMEGLALGNPVLKMNSQNGKMSLFMGILQRQSLTEGAWTDMSIKNADVFIEGGKVRVDITPSGNAAFYKLKGGTGE